MNSVPFITALPSFEWQNDTLNRIHSSPASSLVRARLTRDLVIAFTPYLRGMAKSVWRRHGSPAGLDGLLDVESAAREGLLRAVARWQPGHSKPIIYLASRWILGSAKAEACRLADGCLAIPHKVRRLRVAYRALRKQGSPELNTLLARSSSQLRTRNIVRYLAQSEGHSTLSLSTPGVDPAAESTSLETITDIARIREVLLNECTVRQRLVFYLKFPELVVVADDVGEYTHQDGRHIVPTLNLATSIGGDVARIASIIGVSRARIHQILSELFKKLRRKLD